MENKVLFGLSDVHIAFESENGWETPVAISGAVSLSTSPEGNITKVYADNTVYFVSSSNNGYSGDLEMTLIPDTIKAKMFGWEIDSNGTLLETTDGIPKTFALMGSVCGDVKNRKFVFYKVQANRPDSNAKTKEENIDIETEKIPIQIMPFKIGDKNVIKGTMEKSDTNQLKYNAFFETVYTPDFSEIKNTKLSALTLGVLSLTPAFDSDILSYTATTTNATNAITAVAVDPLATIAITANEEAVTNGEPITWQAGENIVKIIVTNGDKTKTYTITVTKS